MKNTIDKREQENRQLINKVKVALQSPSQAYYEEVRRNIIDDYGYDSFRELQIRAFKELLGTNND